MSTSALSEVPAADAFESATVSAAPNINATIAVRPGRPSPFDALMVRYPRLVCWLYHLCEDGQDGVQISPRKSPTATCFRLNSFRFWLSFIIRPSRYSAVNRSRTPSALWKRAERREGSNLALNC